MLSKRTGFWLRHWIETQEIWASSILHISIDSLLDSVPHASVSLLSKGDNPTFLPPFVVSPRLQALQGKDCFLLQV